MYHSILDAIPEGPLQPEIALLKVLIQRALNPDNFSLSTDPLTRADVLSRVIERLASTLKAQQRLTTDQPTTPGDLLMEAIRSVSEDIS